MNKPKVTEFSPTLFEVLNHSVKIQKKKGRTLIICDCDNASFFGHNQFCYHKQRVLEHIFTKKIKKGMDKLILVYENWCEMKLPQNPELMLSDLKNLRRLV